MLIKPQRSETWHNAFAAPCTSLAYRPLRYGLPKYGVPVPISRALGVIGAFCLMALFHIYALQPILSKEALTRVGIFFFVNGVATVAEGAVWGKKKKLDTRSICLDFRDQYFYVGS